MFGGGSVAFSTFINKNYLAPLPPLSPTTGKKQTGKKTHSRKSPGSFPLPLHGKDNLWIAATMSAFGIEINPDRVAELHQLDPRLTTPTTWADLAGPNGSATSPSPTPPSPGASKPLTR